jgi:anti-sigma-K factor RskA
MRDIRREAAAQPSPATLAWVEPLVWRVAAVAALAAVLFAGSAVVYTSRQSDQITTLWLEDFAAGSALLEE